MTVRAIDASNYTGLFTPAFCQAIKDAGWQHVVVRAGLEHGPQPMPNWEITVQQVDQLTTAGIDWSVYLWCYPSWSPEGTVDGTINILGGRPCRWFHFDWEELNDVRTPVHNVDWTTRALTRAHEYGKLASIYTGGWWWRDRRYMANAQDFGAGGLNVPLWSAQFDHVPDRNVFSPYGGWSAPLFGKQYEGSETAQVAGRLVDFNVFDDSLILPPVEPPPPQPPAELMIPASTAFGWQQDDIAELQLRLAVREEQVKA